MEVVFLNRSPLRERERESPFLVALIGSASWKRVDFLYNNETKCSTFNMLSCDKTSGGRYDNLSNNSWKFSVFDSHIFHALILLKSTNPAVESAPVNAWKKRYALHLCKPSLSNISWIGIILKRLFVPKWTHNFCAAIILKESGREYNNVSICSPYGYIWTSFF